MKLYGGIDLHSTNSVVALTDEQDKVVYQRRLSNDLALILRELQPYQPFIEGLVVESTYNWYWLVDGLMAADYELHLANTAAIVQYEGLKYTDDDTDARWLAKLLRLRLLPEGHIYPKEQRPVRDLLRKRSQLVHQHTANLLSVQNLMARNLGHSLNANQVKRLQYAQVNRLLADEYLALAVNSTLAVMHTQEEMIALLEKTAKKRIRLRPEFKPLLSVSGIGEILGLTIMLETGDIQRLRAGGQLRLLLPLRGLQADEQRQEEGHGQPQERQQIPCLGVCGGGQLRGALQPADQALLPAQASPDQRYRGNQDGGPQAGSGLLLHSARPGGIRGRQGVHMKGWAPGIGIRPVDLGITSLLPPGSTGPSGGYMDNVRVDHIPTALQEF